MKLTGLPIHAAFAAVLLLLITAACAHDVTPNTPVSQPAVVAPPAATAAAPEPRVTTPAPQAASKTPPVAKTPAPTTQAPKSTPTTQASKPAPTAQAPKPASLTATPLAPIATATLDLDALKVRLKETKAIGCSPRSRSRTRSTTCWNISRSTTRAGPSHPGGVAHVLRPAADEGALAAAGQRPAARAGRSSRRARRSGDYSSDPNKFAPSPNAEGREPMNTAQRSTGPGACRGGVLRGAVVCRRR